MNEGMAPTVERPILLLDVDGILNAPRRELSEGWQRGTFNGFCCPGPPVTARLRELHESGRVEIQWLTTWTPDADRLLAEPAWRTWVRSWMEPGRVCPQHSSRPAGSVTPAP